MATKINLDGKSAFIATGGEPFDTAKPTLVFVHGAAMDHTAWTLQARYFAHHGWNVVAPDLPGHGTSDGAPLPSIEAMADWLISALDELGVAKAALAGHSMGALTALEAAARAGSRVTRLALLGVAFPMAVADGFLKLAEQNDPRAYEMMIDWAFARGAHIGHAPVPGLWMIGDALSTVRAARPGTLHAGLKACADYEGGLQAAARVTAPVRLILGREDMMTPVRAASRLAEAFAHAETVVLEDCGHMMMLEKDAAVRRALRDFLSA